MAEKIIVRVSKKGATTIEVAGVKGTACTDLTKSLEKALGSATASVPTNEMYEEPPMEHTQQTVSN